MHHYLISVGKRVQTALIVESGEIRETMHAALLLGYGASALCPYMTFAILDDLVKRGKIQENYATAEANYIKAVKKALLKIMAKMGISTIRSRHTSARKYPPSAASDLRQSHGMPSDCTTRLSA